MFDFFTNSSLVFYFFSKCLTNGYLSINNELLRYEQVDDDGSRDVDYVNEYFIRYVVAFDICKRVALGSSLADATDAVINGVLVKAGGSGGVIALNRAGNIATTFNALGMFRASIDTEGRLKVAIYSEEVE